MICPNCFFLNNPALAKVKFPKWGIHSLGGLFVYLTDCCLTELQELKHFYRDQIFLQKFPTSLAVRKNVTKLLVT